MSNRPPRRDEKGRLLPGGGSLNPGGVPARALALRKEALEGASEVLASMRRIAMESDNEMAAAAAGKTYLERALGKASTPAELPDDFPMPAPGELTPAALLTKALGMLGRSLARFDSQMASGSPLSDAQLAQLGEHARTLATLAREERELAKRDDGAGLSDAELLEKVLAKAPVAALEAALAKARGGNAGG